MIDLTVIISVATMFTRSYVTHTHFSSHPKNGAFLTKFACPRLEYPLCLRLYTDCIVSQVDHALQHNKCSIALK